MVHKPKRPQLGKIKQWSSGLGAKLSGSSATIDSNTKQDLFGEIEQRGIGNSNLYAATEQLWSSLSKKKPLPFDASNLTVDDSASLSSRTISFKPDGKVLPVEAVGIAMTSYGHQFPPGSPYGTGLSSVGQAHIKLGSLQAAFAKDTSNIFLSRIARSKTAIESFHAAMKKLDVAATKLEAAQTKVQKSKKEKRELEEELRHARAAYDEAVSDVEARAEAIQESETDDLDCLSTYIQAHIDYLAQAQAVLEQAKKQAGPTQSNGAQRRPPPTPLSRPQSASSARPTPPLLPRRASARDPIELNRTSSGRTAGSSISLPRGGIHLSSEGSGLAQTDAAAGSLPSNSGFADDANDDDSSTFKQAQKDRKGSRVRMPSFSAASGAVSSMAAGLGGTFSRSKSSGFFGPSSTSNEEGAGPDKEKSESGQSKWSFRSRNRKETGFQDLDGGVPLPRNNSALLRSESDQVHNKVSSEDVDLGLGEFDMHDVLSRSPSGGSRLLNTSKRGSVANESPFSPVSHAGDTSSPTFASHLHDNDHMIIHERGESGLGMDANYLGVNSHVSQQIHANHTGLSAFSDGVDPFSGGGTGMLSPQPTGQLNTDDEEDHDDGVALTGGSRGSSISGSGWAKSLSFSSGAVSGSGKDYRSFDGEDDKSRRRTGGGPLLPSSASNSNNLSRPPPPPVPSSSAFLNKVKAKAKAPPVPPPLPNRSNS